MKKILVNGTFDVVHPGHLALLNYAKSLGDFLVVAIDSDRRVRELKGPHRPINNEFERRTLLENLRAVDEVQTFDSDAELVDIVAECAIMVKGSDYRGKPIVGQEVCPSIVFFERIDEYSSTAKIQYIADRR
jgi:D-beta-D-heptose 7-phosphate kinase/D-beta-D-heptose 1-phosphate adenosyltransferase